MSIFRTLTLVAATATTTLSAGCALLPATTIDQTPAPAPVITAPAMTNETAPFHSTWDTYDAGGEGQYPATIVHYSADWTPGEAEQVCGDDRGGSFVHYEDGSFICVVD